MRTKDFKKFILLLLVLLSLSCGTEVGNPGDAPEENSRTEPASQPTDGVQSYEDTEYPDDEETDSSSVDKAREPLSHMPGSQESGNTTEGEGPESDAAPCSAQVSSTLGQEATGEVRFVNNEASGGISIEIQAPDGSLAVNPSEPLSNLPGLWIYILSDEKSILCKGRWSVGETDLNRSYILTVSLP